MVDYDLQTPMMKQILDIKKKYPDSILMTRMGDFYEMFFDDAKIAARLLDITLTSRGGKHRSVPLAGIPYHAADLYISKLVKKGHKVTICEQVEDPKNAVGLVKRAVTKTITPGAVVDTKMLDSKTNNYIISIFKDRDCFGITFADISTGAFFTTSFEGKDYLFSEIAKFKPREYIMAKSVQLENEFLDELKNNCGACINFLDDDSFRPDAAKSALARQFNTKYLEGFGISDKPLSIRSSGALIKYISDTQLRTLSHLNNIHVYSVTDYMVLDAATQRNLEICTNIADGSLNGTLFGLFDKAKTPMGARLVKYWLLHPLLNISKIRRRHDAVFELSKNIILHKDLRDYLDNMYDVERIISRIGYGNANARDLTALKKSFLGIPYIKRLLSGAKASLLSGISTMDSLEMIVSLISESVLEEPAATLRDGGVINDGFSPELDELRSVSKGGKKWIADIEESERKRTGIKSLKIKYNKVFGYFIEITKSNLGMVPSDYVRKQTTVNGERFITADLKEKESLILGAEEKMKALEYELFMKIISRLSGYIGIMQDAARKIAVLDALSVYCEVAVHNNYVRPDINDSDVVKISDGRHPTVEYVSGSGRFVPNNTYLDCRNNLMNIITGPNMAGKSTYMRQVALIVLMAQAGSFVPASSVSVGVVDRVFTRVGAHDDLVTGQSTFMVEMNETANIVNNATSKSIIILDEIGRGTSTYDGLSIAWSVAEYICQYIGAKTLFATHYHHMNKLKDCFGSVKNYHVSVKEDGDNIIFLRKIEEGGVDKSYGVEVARLAGLPSEIIKRAKMLQARFESGKIDAIQKSLVDDPTKEIIDDLALRVDKQLAGEDGCRQKRLF